MGKIIAVVGNLGAGKTTLTKLLCDQGGFIPYWERPEARPIQADFTRDLSRWALANQMDFYLFRCEQERAARQKDEIAVFDGGFDQDFHVFTRHIRQKGALTQAEFGLCQRFYDLAREMLPPPEMVIRILVDFPTLFQRRYARERKTVDESFSAQEFTDLERLLDDWLGKENFPKVVQLRFEEDWQCYHEEIEGLIRQIKDS